MRDSLGSVQTALLVGGTSEIGLATVNALVADRARTVILAGRDTAGMEDEAERLRRAGAETVEVVGYDADQPAGDSDMIAGAFSRHADIDVVIMAVGVLADADSGHEDPAVAARVVTANFAAPVPVLLAAAAALRRQGHGTIVVLSSVAGERVRKSNFVYGASKAGLDAFAHGLGDALHGSGVDVLVVRPGFVHTRMTAGMKAPPLSTTPDVVAAHIVRGLRDRSAVIWVPGALRWVMLLLRLLPRPVFRRLPL